MVYKIRWSESAVNDLEEIIDYLMLHWGNSSVEKFKEKLSLRLELLSSYPLLHKVSPLNEDLRQSVLNKHISIIYSFDGNIIHIVRLLNNKSNYNI